MAGPLNPEVDTLTHGVLPGSEITEVLFEQLGYLIQYADQERHCLERVKTILLETFNCPVMANADGQIRYAQAARSGCVRGLLVWKPDSEKKSKSSVGFNQDIR